MTTSQKEKFDEKMRREIIGDMEQDLENSKEELKITNWVTILTVLVLIAISIYFILGTIHNYLCAYGVVQYICTGEEKYRFGFVLSFLCGPLIMIFHAFRFLFENAKYTFPTFVCFMIVIILFIVMGFQIHYRNKIRFKKELLDSMEPMEPMEKLNKV